MTFGQIILPSGEIQPIDIRKGFVEASRQINSLGAVATYTLFSGSKQTLQLPAASSSANSMLVVVNTNNGPVTITGESWALAARGNYRLLVSDGSAWWTVGSG